MSESTLKITFTELQSEVGRYLDLNRSVDEWDDNQVADVNEIIKRGLRNFYFPLKTNPEMPAHRWSFLRPAATLTIWDDLIADDAVTATITYASPSSTVTASEAAFYPSMVGKTLTCVTSENTYTITGYTSSTVITVLGDASSDTGDSITIASDSTFILPWDFGGMAGDGKFTYDNANNKLSNITMVSEAQIRKLRQSSISTATPYLAATLPKTTDGTEGQRWEAMFYPPPNEPLVLHYRYFILPDALISTTKEYPYGSAAHSETILESCLAVAESREKDGGDGQHNARFEKFLFSSIDHDNSLIKTVEYFGYNGDNSDDVPDDRMQNDFNDLVTFNGS
jgi:hypothetical protein